jgi:hypothetical protein
MLITDDSKGTADGKERDQLQAMVCVGSEFITYNDHESTVQKSGEFVRIQRESGSEQPRFALLHETAQTYAEPEPGTLADLTGSELRDLATGIKLRKRSRLYVADIDPVNGDLPFREVGGFKAQTRISRHHGPEMDGHQRQYEAVCEANYTAQAGKRRLFAKGDGKLWLVREVALKNDARYFNDSMRTLVTDPLPHTKKRGLRAAQVEVVEVNAVNGAVNTVFSFDVHSGLSFDAPPRPFSKSARQDTDMYDDGAVYAAFSGVLFGSSLNLPGVMRVPRGGDASDTYAVAEPATAKVGGREFTPIIAVYPAPDDVHDSRGSGPYRLTCKRTTPEGGVALGKINFPTLPSLPAHYLAAFGMSLHRLSPTAVVLRVNVHAMQTGAGGSVQADASDAFFMWSQDNGATWAYVAPAVGFPGVFPYGGMLVKDKGTLLAFSWFVEGSSTPVQVHRITASGTAQIATIPGGVFSSGLMAKVGSGAGYYFVPYVPVGFGGAVFRVGADGKKAKRLWMQFDPYWTYKQETPQVIEYPGSRPMLLVSDDGGLTWARKLLPVPWSFRVGFVVSVGEKHLAVPVYAPRKHRWAALQVTVYASKDGGDSWKATEHKVTLPGETWADGGIVVGEQYLDEASMTMAFEQDVDDSALEYNRGELLPLVALRDEEGKLLPANPARPWMSDYKTKEPDYA